MKARQTGPLRLSIGIIVKDGGTDFEKCLHSLDHLRAAIPSELIVLDTGSTDASVEIAKRYTDRVYHFTWIDDFAAARNACLDYAAGEWFLYLDADEWFESTAGIEAFLNGEERNSYMQAGYYVRNYQFLNSQEEYTNSFACRLFRRHPLRRFQGIIHEYVPIIGDWKILDDYVHHYGYASDSGLQGVKGERNIPLLEKQLEADPSAHHWYHLMREYFCTEETDKAWECGEKGLAALKQEAHGEHEETMCSLYHDMISMAYCKPDYEKLDALCEAYFSARTHPYTADLDITAFLANALRRQDRFEEALACYEREMELFRLWDNGEIDQRDRLAGVFICDTKGFREEGYFGYGMTLVHFKRYKEALESFRKIALDGFDKCPVLLQMEFKCIRESKDIDHLLNRYQQINGMDNPELKACFKTLLDKMMREDPDTGGRAAALLAKRGEQSDPFIQLLRMRCAAMENRTERGLLEELMGSADKSQAETGELLYFVFKWQADAAAFLRELDTDKAREYLSFVLELHPDFSRIATQEICDRMPEGLRELYWYCCINERILLMQKESFFGVDPLAKQLFHRYCELMAAYVARIYSPELLESDETWMLPGVHRFGYYAGKANVLKAQGDIPGYLRLLTKAGEAYPHVLPFVKQELSRIQEQLEQEAARQEEVHALMGQIKGQIRAMAANGNLEAAEEALEAYSRVNPNDDEILSLRLQMRQTQYQS